jgi:pentatricopeptide repeat protein
LTKGKQVHGFLVRGNFPRRYVLLTAMINATGMHGHGKQAIDIFERMLQTGLILDLVCFIALLHACSHSKLVDEGKYYRLRYASVADILGRSGRTEKAYMFMSVCL